MRQLEQARSEATRIVSLEAQKGESDEIILVTRRQLEAAEAEIEALKALANMKEASFEHEKHELETALRDVNEQLSSLSKVKATKEEAVNDLKDQLTKALDEVERLQEENKAAKILTQTAQDTMARLAMVEAEKKGSDKRVIELAEMLESERMSCDKRVHDLEQQLAESTTKLASHAARHDNKEMDEVMQENRTLLDQLDKAHEQIKGLETENGEASSESYAALQRKSHDARAYIKRLEEGNGDDGRRESTLSTESYVQNLETAMEKATKHIQELHGVIQEQREEMAALQEQMVGVKEGEKK